MTGAQMVKAGRRPSGTPSRSQEKPMASAKHGVLSWFRRFFLRIALAVILLTVVPVVLLRWIPPPTSAVMVEKRVGEMRRSKGRGGIHYRWTRWNAISAPMGLA